MLVLSILLGGFWPALLVRLLSEGGCMVISTRADALMDDQFQLTLAMLLAAPLSMLLLKLMNKGASVQKEVIVSILVFIAVNLGLLLRAVTVIRVMVHEVLSQNQGQLAVIDRAELYLGGWAFGGLVTGLFMSAAILLAMRQMD